MPHLPTVGALLLPLTALLTPASAVTNYQSSNSTTPNDNNANCTCYVVKTGAQSTTPEYFQYYRFYDFRNLAGGFTSSPPLINQSQDATLVPTWQNNIFNSDAWNTDWGVQNWSRTPTEDFPVPMSNSRGNVWIAQQGNGTYLAMRTTRLDDHQTAAEIENEQKNLMHVSMRMSARVTGDKGAVAGFFTFYDDSNESDIEILTNDPKDQIRYTNQPSVDKQGNEITAASVGPTGLPQWNDWQTHRIDWLPKNSYWYLNGKQVAANTYSVPRKPSFLVLNMWSNGGEWSGNMTKGGSAQFDIQWIEMTFNTSGPATGSKSHNSKRSGDLLEKRSKGCVTVCGIDNVSKTGTPEILSVNDNGEDEGLSGGAIAGIVIGVLALVAILAVAGWFLWKKKRAGSAQKNYEMRTKILDTPPNGHGA